MSRASTPRNDAIRIISHLLAAALGYWLWSHKTEIAAASRSVAGGSADFIIDQLEWFMTAKPAGSLSLTLHNYFLLNFEVYIQECRSPFDQTNK